MVILHLGGKSPQRKQLPVPDAGAQGTLCVPNEAVGSAEDVTLQSATHPKGKFRSVASSTVFVPAVEPQQYYAR
jgi:hypothetical protein